jgi:hypothetical protein
MSLGEFWGSGYRSSLLLRPSTVPCGCPLLPDIQGSNESGVVHIHQIAQLFTSTGPQPVSGWAVVRWVVKVDQCLGEDGHQQALFGGAIRIGLGQFRLGARAGSQRR